MEEGPKPIILTENPKIPIQIEEKTSGDPGNNHFVIGFVLICCSIPMFLALDSFCCLMGFLSLVSGFGFLFYANINTYNWRKENDIKKWTTGEIISVIFIGIIFVLILGTVFEFGMYY
ncbi:MAG: hypothetical protein ACJZ49_02490 [Candidatus Thalassarchaeaceae archaeon]|tara:strand:- start:330 stop:683 length:354 start_codon:yes stop_codon:yes gene_type:complete